MNYEVVPIEGESYEGRQWGYVIKQDGREFLHATTGGTGDCWNVTGTLTSVDDDEVPLHICELDEFIAALEALRESEAHKANVARWA